MSARAGVESEESRAVDREEDALMALEALSILSSHGIQSTLLCMHLNADVGYFKRNFPVQASLLACVCKDMHSNLGSIFGKCKICFKAAEWMIEELNDYDNGRRPQSLLRMETYIITHTFDFVPTYAYDWAEEMNMKGKICRICLQCNDTHHVPCFFCKKWSCCNCNLKYDLNDYDLNDFDVGSIERVLLIYFFTHVNRDYGRLFYVCGRCLTSEGKARLWDKFGIRVNLLKIPYNIVQTLDRLIKFELLCNEFIPDEVWHNFYESEDEIPGM